jgi:ATP-dependent helicase HepA
MQQLQQSELQRLQALATINPNIRQEEIDHLQTQTNDLQHFLSAATMKLDALRVAVITE